MKVTGQYVTTSTAGESVQAFVPNPLPPDPPIRLTDRDHNWRDWQTFRMHFWEASAQRLMQALGAYGFLGLRKGLTSYLEHVPAGLRILRDAAFNAPSLPRLRDVLETCETAIAQHRPSKGRSW